MKDVESIFIYVGYFNKTPDRRCESSKEKAGKIAGYYSRKRGIKLRKTSLTRMSFRPPSDYYCEEVAPIDEQICGLLAKRKELSNNNPGFPNLDRISEWSQQYGLDEDWLGRIFAYMHGKHHLQTQIEPTEFLKFVPILKSVEVDSIMYAVTHMKQYSNSSVVYIETEVNTAEPYVRLGHANFELSISPEYQCRPNGGCGQDRGMQHSFVVTPSLPDDLTGVKFHLSVTPFRREPEIQELFLTEISVTIK